MKILRVSTFPTIKKSGMGLHSYKLCGLTGIHTYFLTPKETDIRFKIPPCTELIEYRFFKGIRPKKHNKFIHIYFFLRRVSSIISFSLKGANILLTKKIDIVHIHSPMYSLIALLGWLLGKKVYITFHGTDYHRIKNSALYCRFSFIYDKVFAISPDMLKKLELIHSTEKVVQINNGIDKDIYFNNHSLRKKQILAVGSLKEEKGFEDLIDAFYILYTNNKSYQLLIAGEGLLRENLQSKIQKLHLSQSIKLIGHKTQSEIIHLYNRSEIFVLSSISEGFPKVLLEAMSCGCKIISTNVGSVSQILETYPYIVEPNNYHELAKGLEKISKDDIRKFEAFYIKVLSLYSWDKVREKYYKIIRGES